MYLILSFPHAHLDGYVSWTLAAPRSLLQIGTGGTEKNW